MAYQINAYGGYGSGALGTVTNPGTQINSYANVTAINDYEITIGTPSVGTATFVVGSQVLVHVSATTNVSAAGLGNYCIGRIISISGSTIMLDKNIAALVMPANQLQYYHVQAIAVAQYDTLNLSSTISPPQYNITTKYGGILAIQCKTAFNLSGSGMIDLAAKGIPRYSSALRPLTVQESDSKYGWANHITARNFLLNDPDGAVYIAAKTLNNTGVNTRIGGTMVGSLGTGFGLVYGKFHPKGFYEGVSMTGGPTSLIVAETISGFETSMICTASSAPSDGYSRGHGRCYIATESIIPSSEISYAVDCLSNPSRLTSLGINSYGTGALGSVSNPSGQINSYAPVTAISADGQTVTIGTAYNGAYETFTAGKTVMFHVSRQTGASSTYAGAFCLATIVSVSGSNIVLSANTITTLVPYSLTSQYKCQLITVAQFDSLTISTAYANAKAYNDSHGCGGILAIAAKTSFNLSSGQINMATKGIPWLTSSIISRPIISWQGSHTQRNKLPLSQGYGAVFILTPSLTVNSTSRVGGATWSAALYGGSGGSTPGPSGSGYGGGGAIGFTGILSRGQTGNSEGMKNGGEGGEFFGMCGLDGTEYPDSGGQAGASIFVVADTITGFNANVFNTAGDVGASSYAYHGGGGSGAPGTCFIYCNNVINPDYTNLVL